MTAMPIMVMMVRSLSPRNKGHAKRRIRKTKSVPHSRFVRNMAMS